VLDEPAVSMLDGPLQKLSQIVEICPRRSRFAVESRGVRAHLRD
jgi:hypothetical protein